MKGNSKNYDDWLIPGLERPYKNAWRVFFVCSIMIVGLAVGYLCTLNIIFQWIAMLPAGLALWCLGYQAAMEKADNHIQEFASKVALILTKILDARMAAERQK